MSANNPISIPYRILQRDHLWQTYRTPRTPGAPVTRADCANVPRPCPWVGCRHNMFFEISRSGSLVFLHGVTDPLDVPPDKSCCLDMIAAHGQLTLAQIGDAWHITRERIRQLAVMGLRKIKRDKEFREVKEGE